jgi:hypothetical protein
MRRDGVMSRSVFLSCVSVFLAVFVVGCGGRIVSVPHAIPAKAQLDLSALSHVWVAGFVTSGSRQVDLNAETVRLIRHDLRQWSRARIVDAEPLFLTDEERLHDVPYWRRLGEEHGSPLIVTGTVKLLLAPPAVVQRGRRTFVMPTGRVLDATVVLINGVTGEVRSECKLRGRMRYAEGAVSSDLSLFFQLMDEARGDWLGAIGAC